MDEDDKDIISELNLTEEEKSGIEKFLEATDFRSKDYIELDKILHKKFIGPPENTKDNEDYINLINQMKEFFPCFALIGFDLEGEDFFVEHAENSMANSALNTKLKEIINYKLLEESGALQIMDMLQQNQGNEDFDGEQ